MFSLYGRKAKTYKLSKRTLGQMKTHVLNWWENPLGPYNTCCYFLLRFPSPQRIDAAGLERGGSVYEEKMEFKANSLSLYGLFAILGSKVLEYIWHLLVVNLKLRFIIYNLASYKFCKKLKWKCLCYFRNRTWNNTIF